MKTVPIGLKPVILVTEVPNCECRECAERFELSPPFAPAYARCTRRLARFVQDLEGVLCLNDLAAVTGLGWGTVKQIVTRRLERDYGHPRLKDPEHLSIDEIYLGRRRKYRKPRTTGRFPELATNF